MSRTIEFLQNRFQENIKDVLDIHSKHWLILFKEETIKKDEVVIDNKPPDTSIKGEKKSFNIRGPSNDRQEKVVEAFKHAWKGYKAHSWGQDELKPLSKTSSSWFNLGLTIVDSLDTIYLMNLKEIFAEARDWVANSLSLDSDRYNNLFEITIRIMGGLLSAYHLSGDEMFLVKVQYICQ